MSLEKLLEKVSAQLESADTIAAFAIVVVAEDGPTSIFSYRNTRDGLALVGATDMAKADIVEDIIEDDDEDAEDDDSKH